MIQYSKNLHELTLKTIPNVSQSSTIFLQELLLEMFHSRFLFVYFYPYNASLLPLGSASTHCQ